MPYIKAPTLLGTQLKIYKQSLKPLTQIQKDILVGTLLGDATMSHSLKRTLYLIGFEQRYDRVSYIYHLYDHFRDFVGSPPRICRKKTQDGQELRRGSVKFQTYSHVYFKPYYELFYDPISRKK